MRSELYWPHTAKNIYEIVMVQSVNHAQGIVEEREENEVMIFHPADVL